MSLPGLFEHHQKRCEDLLMGYLDLLSAGACKVCWMFDQQKVAAPREYHSTGGFMPVLLEAPKFSPTAFRKWRSSEQGFIKGFLQGLLAFSQMSSLDIQRHYAELCQEIFEEDPEAYAGLSFTSQREMLSHYGLAGQSKLLIPSTDLYRHYERHLRPILTKVLKHRDDVWFSHVPELHYFPEITDTTDWLTASYYPLHYSREEIGEFAVNVGGLDRFCHRHTLDAPFGGFISAPEVVRSGSEIRKCPKVLGGRDHPFLTDAKIPMSSWVFVYKDIDGLKMLECEQVTCMHQDVLSRFLKVTDLFLSRVQAYAVDYALA